MLLNKIVSLFKNNSLPKKKHETAGNESHFLHKVNYGRNFIPYLKCTFANFINKI